MANQNVLSTFNFDNKLVRTLDRDGEIWFVASDVCKAIEHSNPRMAIKGLDDDEKTTVSNPYAQSGKGAQELNIINESGLYKLILRSKKPEARKFTKWVTSEVLPQIRKTGSYQIPYTAHPKDTLTLEQQNVIRNLVKSNVAKLPKEQQAGAIIKTWSKLKAHFKVPYRNIPQAEFTEALSVIQRTAADWELVNNEMLPAPGTDSMMLSKQEAMQVLWIYYYAHKMNKTIKALEAPMRSLGSNRAGDMYSQGVEYGWYLKEEFNLMEKISQRFHNDANFDKPFGKDDWRHMQKIIKSIRMQIF